MSDLHILQEVTTENIQEYFIDTMQRLPKESRQELFNLSRDTTSYVERQLEVTWSAAQSANRKEQIKEMQNDLS